MNPRQVVFSVDSKKLAIALNPGVVIFGVPECVPLRWLKFDVSSGLGMTQSTAAHCVATSADGRWICYGGEGGRLNIGSLAPEPGEPVAKPFDPANNSGSEVPEVRPTNAVEGPRRDRPCRGGQPRRPDARLGG